MNSRTRDTTNLTSSELIVLDQLSALCGGQGCESLDVACDQADDNLQKEACLGLVLEYGSWNNACLRDFSTSNAFLSEAVQQSFAGFDGVTTFRSSIQVDENDDTVSHCIGDAESHDRISMFTRPTPPSSLPAMALVLLDHSGSPLTWRYVSDLPAASLLFALSKDNMSASDLASIYRLIKVTADRLADEFHLGVTASAAAGALRIFVAGDRSSVGKSSVCLGLLGNLLAQGYSPDSLAYIKPATQSESTQLVQLYCDRYGIACVPVGPIVYYRGFTRAFLAGETESTDELLARAGRAVDRIAQGKKIVLVDGVGFPAVGSICGTDNACVAKACSYPIDAGNSERKSMGVVLVGGSGVGAAVDAFNLNATYFERANVPVMGAIFNKLAISGFYSLENCKTQVTQYFSSNAMQQRLGRRPYGFVPLFPEIAGNEAMQHVDEYVRVFGNHVHLATIVQDARKVRHDSSTEVVSMVVSAGSDVSVPSKRQRLNHVQQVTVRGRQEIELHAIDAGAAPSA
jgi:dethiobiotin synthetase